MLTTASALRAPAECLVSVNESPIEELHRYVREVTVQMSRRAATTVTIVLDSFRDESGRWLVQDSGVFEPWSKVMVTAWFGTHTEEVMRGYIKQVLLDYPQDMSAAHVTVEGQDALLRLDRNHVRDVRASEEAISRDDELVRSLAKDAVRSVDAEIGLRSESLNMDETAARFLRERAEANGYEFFVREDVLHFHPPRLEVSAAAPILVYAGPETNCLSFKVNHDGHRPDIVRVARAIERGHEPDPYVARPRPDLFLGRRPLSSEKKGLEDFQWHLDRPMGASRAELERRAQAKADENAWKISAEGELDGTLYGHVLLTHVTVEVDGVGETYGGRYYVDEVTHHFDSEGYRQHFKLLRNATN